MERSRAKRSSRAPAVAELNGRAGGRRRSTGRVTSSPGPFQTRGQRALPKFALDAELRGGQTSRGATSTGEKGFVAFQGHDYALSPQVFMAFRAGYEQAPRTEEVLAGMVLHGLDPRSGSSPATTGTAQGGRRGDDQDHRDVDVGALLDDVDVALEQASVARLGGVGAASFPRLSRRSSARSSAPSRPATSRSTPARPTRSCAAWWSTSGRRSAARAAARRVRSPAHRTSTRTRTSPSRPTRSRSPSSPGSSRPSAWRWAAQQGEREREQGRAPRRPGAGSQSTLAQVLELHRLRRGLRHAATRECADLLAR